MCHLKRGPLKMDIEIRTAAGEKLTSDRSGNITLLILPLLMLPFEMRPVFCGVDGAIFVILLLDDTFPLLPF